MYLIFVLAAVMRFVLYRYK